MQSASYESSRVAGFTLIEMSIVLVIIGLIVGGVLVGQDLIRAAEVRATISQIEKYNTAVNTFRGKYGALPGDLNNATALQFGFTQRGQYAGEGDGNGVIEGVDQNAAGDNDGTAEVTGETAMFWVDLTTANGQNLNLIAGSFSAASPNIFPPSEITGTQIDQYLPQAKLGRGNYIYVWSGGIGACGNPTGGDNLNYYGLSAVTDIYAYVPGWIDSNPGLTVAQAYSIDKKMDDGMPISGRVMAMFLNANAGNCSRWGWSGAGIHQANYPTQPIAVAPGVQNCWDNNNVSGATINYSLSTNSGAGVNCGLSFAFP
jgi:prepilin-type N-terminal cleavage/methylation domain-containing protein